MHTASSFSIKIIVFLFVQQYLVCLQYINDNVILHAASYACNARGAWCVVLDFPCSGSSFRYIKKTSCIYQPFVVRQKCVGSVRGWKSGRKEMVAMGEGINYRLIVPSSSYLISFPRWAMNTLLLDTTETIQLQFPDFLLGLPAEPVRR